MGGKATAGWDSMVGQASMAIFTFLKPPWLVIGFVFQALVAFKPQWLCLFVFVKLLCLSRPCGYGFNCSNPLGSQAQVAIDQAIVAFKPKWLLIKLYWLSSPSGFQPFVFLE